MSVYRCAICENYQDADYQGCYEHPDDECECLCEDCYNKFPEPDLDDVEVE